MGLHQTKNLLHSKGNSPYNEEIAYRMGENLCQLYIWQVINNHNVQGTQKEKLQKTQLMNEHIIL
jgi:hypothetical protein